MRDTSTNPERRFPGSNPTRRRATVVLAVAVAVGLSAAVGGAAATSQATDHDPLEVATECPDDTSAVATANPNDETVETTVSWDGEQSSIRVSSVTETRRQSAVEPTRLEFATQPTRESVTVAVSGGETVSIEGLENGTYVLSAVTDGGDEVPLVDENETSLEDGELTLECDAEADAADGPTTANGPVDVGSAPI